LCSILLDYPCTFHPRTPTICNLRILAFSVTLHLHPPCTVCPHALDSHPALHPYAHTYTPHTHRTSTCPYCPHTQARGARNRDVFGAFVNALLDLRSGHALSCNSQSRVGHVTARLSPVVFGTAVARLIGFTVATPRPPSAPRTLGIRTLRPSFTLAPTNIHSLSVSLACTTALLLYSQSPHRSTSPARTPSLPPIPRLRSQTQVRCNFVSVLRPKQGVSARCRQRL
jgi:hypothetical protein